MNQAIFPEIGLEQFDFVKDAGTRNAILVLRTIAERMNQEQKPLFVCFIDYSKAFDKVQHEKLFDILQNDLRFLRNSCWDIDGEDLRFLRNLYWDQTADIEIQNEIKQVTKIKREVRQGCVVSPDLLNLYSEIILRYLRDKPGLMVNGNNLNNERNRRSKSYVGQIHGYKIVTIKLIHKRKQSLQIKFPAKAYIYSAQTNIHQYATIKNIHLTRFTLIGNH